MSMDNEWLKVYEDKARTDLKPHQHGCWSLDGFDELKEVTANILKELQETVQLKTALDVGCGAGHYVDLLEKAGLEVTGMDYSEKMIALAKDNHPSSRFIVANGYNIPFNNKSFDLVISIGALQCLEDYKLFISELCRISDNSIIISTLLTTRKEMTPEQRLKKQLAKDSWPTRDFHPDELTELFHERGFRTKVIVRHKNQLITDGFFVVAQRVAQP